MMEEDIKYRQGRSKKQQESNELVAYWGFLGLIIVFLGIIIYNVFR
jgi:hypothetical protein